MTKKQSTAKAAMLSGPNIYRDTHGNAIYYQKRTNIAYKIAANEEGTFRTLQLRYIIAIISFVLFYNLFSLQLIYCLLISGAVLGYLEFRYYKFLRNLPQSIGFNKKDKITPLDQMITTSLSGLLLRVVLYMALAILLEINIFYSEAISNSIPMQVASHIVAVLAAYMGYKYLTLFMRKKANNTSALA